jgi:hypothetical protein
VSRHFFCPILSDIHGASRAGRPCRERIHLANYRREVDENEALTIVQR